MVFDLGRPGWGEGLGQVSMGAEEIRVAAEEEVFAGVVAEVVVPGEVGPVLREVAGVAPDPGEEV